MALADLGARRAAVRLARPPLARPPSSTATSTTCEQVTEACFDHYAALFTEPYAFDSYDQAFVPGQNWGALETPGCVTYRDEYLPRGRLTDLSPDRPRDRRSRTRWRTCGSATW